MHVSIEGFSQICLRIDSYQVILGRHENIASARQSQCTWYVDGCFEVVRQGAVAHILWLAHINDDAWNWIRLNLKQAYQGDILGLVLLDHSCIVNPFPLSPDTYQHSQSSR